MVKPGDVIENPVTGERMVFLQTGKETNGELLQIDMFVRPGGFVATEHVHPMQDERFVVKSGQIQLRIAGKEQQLRAGDEVTVPKGTPHVWWNSGVEELNVVLEFRPSGRFDAFITSVFALAVMGRTNAKGIPSLLQAAVTMAEFSDVIYATSPPLAVQKVLLPVLASLGRLLGYKGEVPYPAMRRGALQVLPAVEADSLLETA